MTRPNFALAVSRLNAPRLIGLVADELSHHGCGDCLERPVADYCKPCLLALWSCLDSEVRSTCRSAGLSADVLAFPVSAPPSSSELEHHDPPPRELTGKRCGHCLRPTAGRRSCHACHRVLCPTCIATKKRVCPERGGRAKAVSS